MDLAVFAHSDDVDAVFCADIQLPDIRRLYGINIIAIERDHRTDVEFSPDSRFQNGDTILVIGKSEKIDRFERSFQD